MTVAYTLADLARMTGAKPRTIQLWADAGVIVAAKQTERKGSGTHRRFSRDEAIIACIAAAAARFSIGELQNVTDAFRQHLRSKLKSREIIEDVIAGRAADAYLIMTTREPGVWGATILEPGRDVESLGHYQTYLLKTKPWGGQNAVTFTVLLNNQLKPFA